SATAATPGAGGNDQNDAEVTTDRGGTGGVNGAGGKGGDSMADNMCRNTGGGGGGIGRIYLRSRGNPSTNGATISPNATTANNL
ncbi:MAG TPA: hypothetical protein VF334_13875, partial [Polyangia bacterium]